MLVGVVAGVAMVVAGVVVAPGNVVVAAYDDDAVVAEVAGRLWVLVWRLSMAARQYG